MNDIATDDTPSFVLVSTREAQEAHMDAIIEATFASPHEVTAEDAARSLTTALACLTVAEGFDPLVVARLFAQHVHIAKETSP